MCVLDTIEKNLNRLCVLVLFGFEIRIDLSSVYIGLEKKTKKKKIRDRILRMKSVDKK